MHPFREIVAAASANHAQSDQPRFPDIDRETSSWPAAVNGWPRSVTRDVRSPVELSVPAAPERWPWLCAVAHLVLAPS